jgi:hypothetical protein
MRAATKSYVDDVLRAAPEEKAALLAGDYAAPALAEEGESDEEPLPSAPDK